MKVIVNSLPKSGTHLLGKLLENLGFEEWEPGLTGALLRETHRNPLRNLQKRRRRPAGDDNGLWIDLDVKGNRVARNWLHKYLNRIPDGSFVSGHLPYSAELSEFLKIHGFKTVYISRDPRDVLISYVNFQKNRKEYPFHAEYQQLSLDECIAHMLGSASRDGLVTASLRERLENSIGWISDTNVFATTFEALIGPRGGGAASKQLDAVKGVCDYLELGLPNSRLQAIADRVFDTKSETFHKGLIGQWQTVFDDKQQELVNREVGDFLKKLGYA